MLSLSTCTYLPIFIPLVLTKPLAPVADQSLQWPGNTTALASNQLLLPSPNLSVGNGVKVVCDGAAYGSNLDIEDCINGVEYIWTGPAELPFAYRHTPFQKEFAIPLPWRSLGDKAHCYTQISVAGDRAIGHASWLQIREAGIAVLEACEAKGVLMGGIATNIGGDNKLAVVITSYKPPGEVACRGRVQNPRPFVNVLGDMEVTTDVGIWAPYDDPSADVGLPALVNSEQKAVLKIFGLKDTTSWYKMWEAAMAVWAICIRKQKGGGMRELGESGRLALTFTAGAPSVRLSGNGLKEATA